MHDSGTKTKTHERTLQYSKHEKPSSPPPPPSSPSHHLPSTNPSLLNTNSQRLDFIRTSCNTTPFPKLCYDSLSHFSRAIQSNPTRLARVAIVVSLSHARRNAAYLTNLPADPPKLSGFVEFCAEMFDDAVDCIGDSLNQMRTFDSGAGSVRSKLSKVQTWMSGALACALTCEEEMKVVEDGPIKKDVVDRALFLEKVLGNAITMVQIFANSVS